MKRNIKLFHINPLMFIFSFRRSLPLWFLPASRQRATSTPSIVLKQSASSTRMTRRVTTLLASAWLPSWPVWASWWWMFTCLSWATQRRGNTSWWQTWDSQVRGALTWFLCLVYKNFQLKTFIRSEYIDFLWLARDHIDKQKIISCLCGSSSFTSFSSSYWYSYMWKIILFHLTEPVGGGVMWGRSLLVFPT